MSGLVVSDTLSRPDESILGIGYSLMVSAEQTGSAYELMKFVVPAGAGPPPHVHSKEDEAFCLIEGEIELSIGEQTIHAKRGTFVHLPRHVPHGFRNLTDHPASFLCLVMPGNLAGFFDAFKRPWPEDAEQPTPANEEDIGKMMLAADQYGIQILGGD